MVRIDTELGGELIKSNIECVGAKVFHDNAGRLSLEYHGEAKTESGKIVCIDIDRINLDIEEVKCTSCSSEDKFLSWTCNCIRIPFEVTDGIAIRYKEKEMTKAEIEKLLGYKIKIVG